MNGIKKILLAFIICLLSCSTVSCVKRIPLHEKLDTNEIRVAVFLVNNSRLNGEYQHFATGKIEEAITRDDFLDYFSDDKVEIKLIDRNKLSYIMEEQSFQSSGVVNHEQLIEMGKIAGLQVLIIVEPVTIGVEDFRYMDKKTYCTSRKAYSTVRITALRIDTAQIIKTVLYEEDKKESQYDEYGYRKDNLPSKDKIILNTLKHISDDFGDDFKEIL